jgi:hypothetical protein
MLRCLRHCGAGQPHASLNRGTSITHLIYCHPRSKVHPRYFFPRLAVQHAILAYGIYRLSPSHYMNPNTAHTGSLVAHMRMRGPYARRSTGRSLMWTMLLVPDTDPVTSDARR